MNRKIAYRKILRCINKVQIRNQAVILTKSSINGLIKHNKLKYVL